MLLSHVYRSAILLLNTNTLICLLYTELEVRTGYVEQPFPDPREAMAMNRRGAAEDV